MKIFLFILICIFFAISIVYFGINVKKYLSIYNDFVDGIKTKKAYKTNDNVLLKSHFKKAINNYCITYSAFLIMVIGFIIWDFLSYGNTIAFHVNVIPELICCIYLFPLMRMFIIAKSHTYIMLGRHIFKISDIKSVEFDSKKAFKRYSLTLKSGKVKKFNLYLDKLAYDFILKTIEENAEVKI